MLDQIRFSAANVTLCRNTVIRYDGIWYNERVRKFDLRISFIVYGDDDREGRKRRSQGGPLDLA